jgi:heme oxygenase (biliverdin-IX-beta and delta-forming)
VKGTERRTGAVLAHLRAVTRPAHNALEGALGLLDEHLDLDAYKDVLARFYGFWSGWQPQVTAMLQDETLSGPRRRLHFLVADLTALGVSSLALKALPLCPLTELRDAAEALGSLYVMEGSTLGGQRIRRNVERCLGGDGRVSCSYFNGYGAETGLMWRSFLAGLEGVPTADAERLGRGASATFERLGWWLTRTRI